MLKIYGLQVILKFNVVFACFVYSILPRVSDSQYVGQILLISDQSPKVFLGKSRARM